MCICFFFFSSRRRHTRLQGDWSSDVCSSDLANRVERIVLDEEVRQAETVAPFDTRAYFRAACVKKWPQEVYAASWTSVLFDAGNAVIKKVPLLEPLRGTEALTKGLLDESETVDVLLEKLKA